MHRRESEQHCAAVIGHPTDIVQRLLEYARGFADGQDDRRSG
jgi:hypothetical protein